MGDFCNLSKRFCHLSKLQWVKYDLLWQIQIMSWLRAFYYIIFCHNESRYIVCHQCGWMLPSLWPLFWCGYGIVTQLDAETCMILCWKWFLCECWPTGNGWTFPLVTHLHYTIIPPYTVGLCIFRVCNSYGPDVYCLFFLSNLVVIWIYTTPHTFLCCH